MKVGIVGGGIAGATVAMHLAKQGLAVTLFEAGKSLVNGPPVCHLHAGGNLYREISDEQCLTLLSQSIDTLVQFPHCANVRPTVIAVPKCDAGDPAALMPRLSLLQANYANIVAESPSKKVMGEPEDYYRTYSRDELEKIVERTFVGEPAHPDDWMVPFAKHIDLDALKYPVVLVQEYGLSVFRMASTAELFLGQFDNVDVQLSTPVTDLVEANEGWLLKTEESEHHFDFVINACGFLTGTIDNMVGYQRDRMVEYKAAYVSHWAEGAGYWPEVIIHGERGTPQGMAQMTPYADGFFQLHGMTEEITLFKHGLVASSQESAQPDLGDAFKDKIAHQWPESEQVGRTLSAIKHLAQFMPSFARAEYAGQPLCGAQQIPGDDPTLRAADVSFEGSRYARAEIVKASSALAVAEAVVNHMLENQLVEQLSSMDVQQPTPLEVEALAKRLAVSRGYPDSLAKVYGAQGNS